MSTGARPPPDRSIRPRVMAQQVHALASDLRDLSPRVAAQVDELFAAWDARTARRFYLTGAGDSQHASIAARMAFERCPSISCSSMPVQELLDHDPGARGHRAPESVVIATSASGSTPRVVQAVRSARAAGARTIAVTGRADSKLAEVAEHAVLVELRDDERSPGIRTYQASLLALLLIALRLADAHGLQSEEGYQRGEIDRLADVIDATVEALSPRCRQLAEAIADASVMVATGTGPSNGTARFAAAKIVEGTAILAVGQDLEEWWHVERFARPFDMPLFVIAPPGRSRWRAVELAAAARDLGRRVVTVQHHQDDELARHAHTVLPVAGDVREELSGIPYHVFAGLMADHLAEHLGRAPFQDRDPAGPPR